MMIVDVMMMTMKKSSDCNILYKELLKPVLNSNLAKISKHMSWMVSTVRGPFSSRRRGSDSEPGSAAIVCRNRHNVADCCQIHQVLERCVSFAWKNHPENPEGAKVSKVCRGLRMLGAALIRAAKICASGGRRGRRSRRRARPRRITGKL